jgi:hypothetical protein
VNTGSAGAIAARPGSAPVGVDPAWPTCVEKSFGCTFVGEAGGDGSNNPERAEDVHEPDAAAGTRRRARRARGFLS